MKTLLLNCLLIVILLVSCSSPSSPSDSYTPEQSKIIGTPIKIGSFEVAQNDLPAMMSWWDAIDSCANLGSGWRLPTKDELNLIYLNKDKIGGLDKDEVNGNSSSYYWSSSNEASSSTLAWKQGFDYGDQHISNKYDTKYVRAIRTF